MRTHEIPQDFRQPSLSLYGRLRVLGAGSYTNIRYRNSLSNYRRQKRTKTFVMATVRSRFQVSYLALISYGEIFISMYVTARLLVVHLASLPTSMNSPDSKGYAAMTKSDTLFPCRCTSCNNDYLLRQIHMSIYSVLVMWSVGCHFAWFAYFITITHM